ncbi:MAG: DUF6432 family protein [Halanaeroarchaeum sp.]
MHVRSEFRDRDALEVAILEALADRGDEGMTVFEVRSHVDAGIDDIESALGALKEDGLIHAEESGERTVIKVDDRVTTEESVAEESGLVDGVLDRLGL